MKRLILLVLMLLAARADAGMPDSFRTYVPFKFYRATAYLAPELAKTATGTRPGPSENYTELTFTTTTGITAKLVFDEGPSEDPNWEVHINGGEHPASVPGDEVYISASGNVYSDNFVNEHHRVRRKFTLSPSGLNETPQPYYLVDQECKLTTAASLYVSRCDQGEKVATLPAKSKVRVLLAEFDQYTCTAKGNEGKMPFLVATPFGLVGWVSTTSGYMQRPGSPIDCIRFMGD